MDTRTFADLTTPDTRSLSFTPLGLSPRGLTPESAVEFQQRAIAVADLVPGVPEGTRSSFERLRMLHTYGVLCYDLFTVVEDLTSVVLEQALHERFLTFYGGTIPLVRRGVESEFPASDSEALNTAFRRRGSHEGWQLRLRNSRTSIPVPLTMGPLLRWARHEGLLHGQRNRRLEEILDRIRNRFAHGSGFRIGMANQSARAIHDLAEIINQLWGALTPGGRLYPTPLEREVLVIGWSQNWSTIAEGGGAALMRADQLAEFTEHDWTYLVVRGVRDDPRLWDFDARYELTVYPSNLLWGPGTRDDALAWLEATAPEGDEVHHLDRLFAVRRHDCRLYPPCRPEFLLALPPEQQTGTWHVVRADFPEDCLRHVSHIAAGEACGTWGCAIDDIAQGSWADAVTTVRNLVPGLNAAVYSEARVPQRWPLVAEQ